MTNWKERFTLGINNFKKKKTKDIKQGGNFKRIKDDLKKLYINMIRKWEFPKAFLTVVVVGTKRRLKYFEYEPKVD